MRAPGETMLALERLHVRKLRRNQIWECPQDQNIGESSTCRGYRAKTAEQVQDGYGFRYAQGLVRRDDRFLCLRCHRLVGQFHCQVREYVRCRPEGLT